LKGIIFILFTLVFLMGCIEKQEALLNPLETIIFDYVIEEDDIISNNYYLNLYPESDREVILKYTNEYDVPIRIIYRLHYIESKFKADAIRHETNGTKSIGYSQLNDSNKEYFAKKFNDGKEVNLYDKEENIRIGIAYLKYLHDRTGNWIDASICYNWGIGNFMKGKEVPQMTIDYAYTIYYGADYVPFVKKIKGAVENIK